MANVLGWGGANKEFPSLLSSRTSIPPSCRSRQKILDIQQLPTHSHLLFSSPALMTKKENKILQMKQKKKKISGFNVNFRQPSALGSISLKKPLCQLSFWTNTPWKFDERWKENTWKNLSAGWGGWRVLFSQDKSHIEQSKSVWHNSASLLAFTWALEELRHNLDKPRKMTQFIHTNCQEICVYLKKNSLTIETISLPAAAGKSGCQAMPGWRKFYFKCRISPSCWCLNRWDRGNNSMPLF